MNYIYGFSLLLPRYVRKQGNDAKNLVILRFFFVTESREPREPTENPVKCGACAVSKNCGKCGIALSEIRLLIFFLARERVRINPKYVT